MNLSKRNIFGSKYCAYAQSLRLLERMENNMGIVKLSEFRLGDMIAQYFMDETSKLVEMGLIPVDCENLTETEKKHEVDGLVQLKLVGDAYPGGYLGGMSMRRSDSTLALKFERQEVKKNNIDESEDVITYLRDERGYQAIHHLKWIQGDAAIETYTEFTNLSTQMVTLEMLSSFSLSRITPFVEKDAYESLLVHRMRSVWSMEGRLESRTMEELQLEPAYSAHAIRCERFGQAGSMPVNHWFPFLAIEDTKTKIFWGVQLAHNASWQMEIYRKDDYVAISGGIADREFGHWMKQLKPQETLCTPKAIISVCYGGDIDQIAQRLTSFEQRAVDAGPAIEQDLPILFNEYCTTWGNPSHDCIERILKTIGNKGFSYFVIDSGWFKKNGGPWEEAPIGDYDVEESIFPYGFDKTIQMIRDAGMEPGIWFEIENVACVAKAYHWEEHLLKRDGVVLTTSMRRFWNLTDPWVEQYLTGKVIGTLQKYGISYIKMDYNDTIGIGCDGAESLGEGLRKNMEASYQFVEKMKREIPGIIIENCASGGHHLEPLMMQATCMASFSDAHECEEIPIIAANLHRVILPRQSQIWAVLRKEDSLKRVAYSMINTFLGRMCLSGDVFDLSQQQWDLIEQGMRFYKLIAPAIKNGYTYRYGTEVKSYRHPKGWQGILRVGEDGSAYALFHVFYESEGNIFEIPFPKDLTYQVKELYSDQMREVVKTERGIALHCEDEMCAVAVLLEKVEKAKK